jgi:hypothetical protein
MRIRIAGAASAVAALALLTACHPGADAGGSGDTGTTATATAGTATSQAAVQSGAGQGGAAGAGQGTGKTIKVCDVISAAQAAKITGQPYTTAAPSSAAPGSGDWTSKCAYNNDDATAEGVNVSFANVNAQSTWNLVHADGVTDISGLGNKAFWDNDNTLYVLSGSDIIQVNGLSSQQQSVDLAKPVLAALS